MSSYLGTVRFNDGAAMMIGRESIEECKIAVENYICELPKGERKFRRIFIRQFPSGYIVAEGWLVDEKVYWEEVTDNG